MNWLLNKILSFGGKRLDGYKTKIGGLGLICYGIIGAINVMFPEAIPGVTLTVNEVVGSITGGFVALGVGGKIDKNTTAVKEAANGGGIPEAPRQGGQSIITPELSVSDRTTLNSN